MKYWSMVVTTSKDFFHKAAIKKYGGPIYVNDLGGFFTKDCVKEIHETVFAKTFPPLPSKAWHSFNNW